MRPSTTLLCASLALASWALPSSALAQASSPTLPPVVATELKALEETYRLLDAVADKAWPGWTGYREIPFLFEFENNLRVLVGHPNPPKPFELIPGLTIGGHTVSADQSRQSALELKRPFTGGGGPIGFGQAADGSSVYTVHISVRGVRPSETPSAESGDTLWGTEEKVLLYLHELFHCYQRGHVEPRFGNLQYNPDTNYALWSQVEGLALERAYREPDSAKARERLKDFVVARALKRASMTADQQSEESADDVREGTATYVMLRALEIVKAGGFQPGLTTAEDPEYRGFANAGRMIDQYVERLVKAAERHEDPKMKCYDYGCFQCAISQRLFPGWQKAVEGGMPMDAVIAKELAVSDAERAGIESRLRTEYPVEKIRASADAFTRPRDEAYQAIANRQGRTYIIGLKPVRAYVDGLVRETGKGDQARTSFHLGLLRLYPSGYPGFHLDEVEMSAVSVPMLTDQLYYLRIVDPDWKSRAAYSVTGTKQPDGSYTNAVVVTPLFTLKAPRLRVRETGQRVRIEVLERVTRQGTR